MMFDDVEMKLLYLYITRIKYQNYPARACIKLDRTQRLIIIQIT